MKRQRWYSAHTPSLNLLGASCPAIPELGKRVCDLKDAVEGVKLNLMRLTTQATAGFFENAAADTGVVSDADLVGIGKESWLHAKDRSAVTILGEIADDGVASRGVDHKVAFVVGVLREQHGEI